MLASARVDQFVTFFKALADDNRVKIVGLLAYQPYSVEELAAILGVTSATISHHLQKLVQADLVSAQARQYYNVYALRSEVLHQMAEQLLSDDAIREAAPIYDRERYSDRVLENYLVHGRLKEIPSQLKKREAILQYIAKQFELGKVYSEKRVNELLKTFHRDGETLLQDLIRMKLLVREDGKFRRLE
jgi:predicted transcriptional regulator